MKTPYIEIKIRGYPAALKLAEFLITFLPIEKSKTFSIDIKERGKHEK